MTTHASVNLGRNYSSAAEFRANAMRVRVQLDGAIIGFQEIDEADTANEHLILRDVFHHGYAWAGWDTRVPIAVPRRFRIVSQDVVRASRGLRRQTPARVVVVAVLEHADRPLPPLVVINWHQPRKHPLLRSRRRKVLRVVRRLILEHYEAGRTVVYTTDANDLDLEKLHPREITLAKRGLDYVRAVVHPNGLQLEPLRSWTVDLTIDGHEAVAAAVRLTRPKRGIR